MKTATPLLVSIPEATFQLSLSKEDIGALIRDGELVAVVVRGQVLVVYESMISFTRRATGTAPTPKPGTAKGAPRKRLTGLPLFDVVMRQ